MNFLKLEQNICDVIKEEQIKLGYQSETIRLYYPLGSLNNFLGTAFDTEEMKQALVGFTDWAAPRFGQIHITNKAERFCFRFPPETADYVHEHTEQGGFLYDLIHTVSGHGVTIEDVLAQFRKYSSRVHVEKVTNGEFDWLVYFEDGNPDEYRYCLTNEGHHVIYHRYTEEDYREFYF